MSAPHNNVVRRVREWARYAEDDLRMARQGMLLNPPPSHLVAYHAQQAVEKYLKAFLIYREVSFAYTHRIDLLLDDCKALAAWIDLLRDAERLTPYAVFGRYPGSSGEVTKEDATEAIGLAEMVRDAIRPEFERFLVKDY
jgi:HEPN domain-containing protein